MKAKVEGDPGAYENSMMRQCLRAKLRLKTIKHMVLDTHRIVDWLYVRRLLHADQDNLHRRFATNLGPWETFWMLFYAFAT